MAGITLEQAESRLTAYMAAETAVLGGQEYSIAGRRLRRADLVEIRAGIREWDAKVKELSNSAAGRARSRTVTPDW